METVTVLWAIGGSFALTLAVVCGLVWLIERQHLSSLMLCILGVTIAVLAYGELGMMRAASAAEYEAWVRWNFLPVGVALSMLLLFVHHYVATGRVWLLWTIILARTVMVLVNFSVHPNFNFSSIESLRSVSFVGDQVSAIDVATYSERQWFAVANLILLMAYLVDAAIRRWQKGGRDSRGKALAVGLGIAVPMLYIIVDTQLLVFGVLHHPVSNVPWFLGALLVMAGGVGRDFVMSGRERLELAELRNRLTQVDRISVMGQLASTLAHELAQPLAATATNVDAARAQLTREKPDLEEVGSILDDIGADDRRAAEIIDRMRQLFKRRTIEMEPLRVEELVQDVIALVSPEARSKHVVLSVLMPPGLRRVLGDKVHLSQVLLNLVMNSIDALQCRPRDARRIVIEAQANDAQGEVELAVRDSGPGMPNSLTDNIFKPFFTTKPEGLGTGLALSRRIIEAHGGRMWADHTPQQGGATFRFRLKQAAADVV